MDNKIMVNSPFPLSRNYTPVKSGNEDTVMPAEPVSSEPSSGMMNVSSSNEQQITEQLERIIRAVQGPEKSFEISVHKQTNAIMVKVFDKQTGDLIRELPSEKLLDVAGNMMEINGLLFDQRA